jgi:hypothetical protein
MINWLCGLALLSCGEHSRVRINSFDPWRMAKLRMTGIRQCMHKLHSLVIAWQIRMISTSPWPPLLASTAPLFFPPSDVLDALLQLQVEPAAGTCGFLAAALERLQEPVLVNPPFALRVED